MKNVKKQLENLKMIKYNSAKFKTELRTKLIREYRKFKEVKIQKKNIFFKFAMTPIIAIFMLAILISYEYINKPMTAYAYLEQVSKNYSMLQSQGVKIRTTHIVNNEKIEIESSEDKDGNLKIQLLKNGAKKDNFLIKNGVLYIEETQELMQTIYNPNLDEEEINQIIQELKEEKLDELKSILELFTIAEISNPMDEWNKIMQKENVKINFLNNNLVEIIYEETVNHEVRIHTLYFQNFKPISKEVEGQNGEQIEQIEYNEITQFQKEIEINNDYEIFIESNEFNEKVIDFIDSENNNVLKERNLENIFNDIIEDNISKEIEDNIKEESLMRNQNSKPVQNITERKIDLDIPTTNNPVKYETKITTNDLNITERKIDLDIPTTNNPVEYETKITTNDLNITEREINLDNTSMPHPIEYEDNVITK